MRASTLETILAWGLRLIVVTVPFLSLIISRSMLFPYITGRNFAFRILIEIGLVLWVGLIALKREYRPSFSPLLIALSVFLVVIGLADLLGVNPLNSFWSRYERMEGYLILLHLVGYFLILTSVIRTKRDWKILFNFFVGVGVIVSIYGVLQRMGYLTALQGGRFRVDGTIGNPTYLAAYLMFMIAFGVYFLGIVRARWGKIIYGVITAFLLTTLYFTASRGPVIGIVASLIVAALLLLLFSPKQDPMTSRRRIIGGSVLALIVVLPLAFWLLRDTSLIKSSPTLSRFASISLEEKTTRSRFMIWRMSWEGFKERPVLGWGQENYIEVFSKYYNPKLFDQEPWFDRSHNIVFDWLINGGILGFLSYVSIFGAAFYMIGVSVKKKNLSFFEGILISALLTGYFIQNLFVFDNFNTYTLFFTVLGFIHASRGWSVQGASIENSSPGEYRKKVGVSLALTGATALIMAGAIYAVNIRPMGEAVAVIDALRLLSTPGATVEKILEAFEKALSYRTAGDNEVREQFGRLAINLVDNQQVPSSSKQKFIETALQEIETQVSDYPNDIKARLLLGNFYNKLAAYNPSYREKAIGHIRVALDLSPNRQQVYFSLADTALAVDDYEKALEYLENALALEPHYGEAQANVAIVAMYAGKTERVRKAIQDLTELAPRDVLSLARVADALIGQQQLKTALDLYKRIVEIDPGEPKYFANLAGLYLSQGLRSDARAAAEKAALLDPQNFGPKVEQFLKDNNL
jgi:O-antigen ligase/tetratricopeptide (TPR) repeat protein